MSSVFQALGISDADLAAARKMIAGHFNSNSEFSEKYKKYIAQVGAALLEVYPPAKAFSPDDLVDIISLVDVIAPDSRAFMKRLKEACTGCGWCCSQTRRIVVDEVDTIRISNKLKQKRENLFTLDGKGWVIKKAQPCGWWNPSNGRCVIYNDRPSICRTWPLGITDQGLNTIQPVWQCRYAVMLQVNKVIRILQSAANAG